MPDLPRDFDAAPPQGGACKGKPTQWWFPEFFRTMTTDQKRKVLNLSEHARKVCAGCKVATECLDYSLSHEPFGIWGGFDEQQRLRIRVDRKIAPSYRTHAGLRPTRSKQMSYRRWLGFSDVSAHG